jgi:hypothetical protein
MEETKIALDEWEAVIKELQPGWNHPVPQQCTLVHQMEKRF